MGVNGMGRFHQGIGWEQHGLGAAKQAPLKVEKAGDFGSGGVHQGRGASKAGALPGIFCRFTPVEKCLRVMRLPRPQGATELCNGPIILEDDARQPHLSKVSAYVQASIARLALTSC
jgi:hypothetical protein